MSGPPAGEPVRRRDVRLAAKARRQLARLPQDLRREADEILRRLPDHPTAPTPDTGRMRAGVANRYAYHARLDYQNRLYWSIEADGSVYVWQIGGHLPLGAKNWS